MEYSLTKEQITKNTLKNIDVVSTFKEYEKEVILYGASNHNEHFERLYIIRLAPAIYEEQVERYFDDLIYISTNYPNIEDICNSFTNMDKTVYDINGDKCYCFKLAQFDEVLEPKIKSICRNITPEMIQNSLPKYKRLFLGPIIDKNNNESILEVFKNHGIYIKACISNSFNLDNYLIYSENFDTDGIVKEITDRFEIDSNICGVNRKLSVLADVNSGISVKEIKEKITLSIDYYFRYCLRISNGENISTANKGLKLILKTYKNKIDIADFVRYILQITLYDNPEILANILMEGASEITQYKAGQEILSYVCELLSEDKVYKLEDIHNLVDEVCANEQKESKSRRITIKRASTGRTTTMRV